MNETMDEPQLPPPIIEPVAEPAARPVAGPAPLPPAKRRIPVWPVFFILGFLVLAGGEAWLWQHIKAAPDNSAAVAALNAQTSAQISDLQSRLTALSEARTDAAPAPDNIAVQANLAQNLAAVTAQVNAMQNEVATDHGALTTLAANAQDLTKLTAKITQLNRLSTARMALEAGQPLGDLAGAPPALAKFAATPPPTMAQLVLGFPATARAAAAASGAGDGKAHYWSRVTARLESLITISDGTHVLVGAPAAEVLQQAQTLLDAGDLAGAVAALQTLSPTTQAAMGSWLGQAQDLLAARAAIIRMAGAS